MKRSKQDVIDWVIKGKELLKKKQEQQKKVLECPQCKTVFTQIVPAKRESTRHLFCSEGCWNAYGSLDRVLGRKTEDD